MSGREIAKVARVPEDMTRLELLAYCRMLEQQVEFLNASVRRTEADAVITIAALVHKLGGKAAVTQEEALDMPNFEIASGVDPVTRARTFRVRRKGQEDVDLSAPFAEAKLRDEFEQLQQQEPPANLEDTRFAPQNP